MRGFSIFASLALGVIAVPVQADHHAAPKAVDTESNKAAVIAAADAFFSALRDENKAALAQMMIPEAVIYIHNRMTPGKPQIRVVTVMDHLENWAKSPSGTDERMVYETVLIDGDMAQVWGPYVFLIDGEPAHCGINSLSFVKTPHKGWALGNTSFTMEPVNECKRLGAPEAKQ
ncbi:hypothetical protein FGU71_08250 [Erythrobacter insulae]|uniref:Nuclear transport factor 2 family protein n=1 Tax=Erythrobacter insulae TaxID=2584124 RepID=A0A547PCH2_9SPHN|nr:hypothetical protein [Erythrobacter insulae]TRD11846.1 hypothetical protein FGU71_08250 [Erythrobacter insulae]